MLNRSIAAGVVAWALALAGTAAAQVSTACQVIGQQIYCNSTAPPPATSNYGAFNILTPSQVMQQGAEAQLANIRAQQAQAELEAYREAQAQRRAELEQLNEQRAQLQAAEQAKARALAYATRVAECLKGLPPSASSEAIGACVSKSVRLD